MANSEELDYEAFQDDLNVLVNTLKDSFESNEVSFFVDDFNDTLYVKLEGLNDYTEDEIEEIATPILEELDMDFDEVILLPF